MADILQSSALHYVNDVLRQASDRGLPRKAQLRQQLKVLEKLEAIDHDGREQAIRLRRREIMNELEALMDPFGGVDATKIQGQKRRRNKDSEETSPVIHPMPQKSKKPVGNSRVDLIQPCSRCKSDLYSRLLVKCAICSFRMHTYCFEPPMLHMPKGKKWFCEQCIAEEREYKEKAQDKTPGTSGKDEKLSMTWSPPMMRASSRGLTSSRCGRPVKQEVEKNLSQRPVSQLIDNLSQTPTIARTRSKTIGPYEWREFCQKKLEVIRSGSDDQLVYFPKKEALVSKAVASWNRYIQSRKMHSRKLKVYFDSKEDELPSRHNIMCQLTPEQLVEAKEKLKRPYWHQELENTVLPLAPPRRVPEKSTKEIKQKEALDSIATVLDISEDVSSPNLNEESSLPPFLDEAVEDNPQPFSQTAFASVLKEATATEEPEQVDKATLLLKQEQQIQEAIDFKKRQRLVKKLIVPKAEDDRLSDEERQKRKFIFSARRIQRCYRRFTSRQRQQEALKKEQNAAAVIINLRVRAYLFRLRKIASGEKQKAMDLIQSNIRNQQAREAAAAQLQREKDRKRASVTIYRFFVGPVATLVSRKHRAATKLQCRYRILKAKRTTRKRRTDKELEDQHHAATAMQCMFRKGKANRQVRHLRETKAVTMMQRRIRGWQARKRVALERERVAVIAAARQLYLTEVDDLDSVGKVLHDLALYYYEYGDYWNAAAFFQRASTAKFDLPGSSWVACGYVHHLTWHISYDAYNLKQAEIAHEKGINKDKTLRRDAYILNDIATVHLQLGKYDVSLRTLSHMIQVFPNYEKSSDLFLLAGMQLQLIGKYRASIEYFVHLSNVETKLPFQNYTTVDMMLGVVYAYRQTGQKKLAREGTHAAFQAYKFKMLQTLYERQSATEEDMWYLLAHNAVSSGHYAYGAKMFIYAIGNYPSSTSMLQMWIELADALRHLGKHKEAFQASQSALQLDPSNDYIQSIDWGSRMKSFEDEMTKMSHVEFIHKLINY